MTSKEMEARSGVARANIRYYEAEGLLTPDRAKNGYRDYSEADLAALEKIRLLRRLGVSVEELKALQSGTAQLEQVLDDRLAQLRGQRQELERVEQVCGALRAAGETFATLEAGKYLRSLDEGESAPELPEKDALPAVYDPWRRLFARLFDEFLWSLLLISVCALAGINPARLTGSRLLYGLLLMLVIGLLEPLLIALTGTTAGKALLGMRLARPDGRRLTVAESYARHGVLLLYGMGFSVPIWSQIQMYRSWRRGQNGEPQPWDAEVAYFAKPVNGKRIAALVAVGAAALTAAEAANSAAQLPPNRGDLTVAEFAENFNRQAAYMGLNLGAYLDEEGRWQEVTYPETAIVIQTDVALGKGEDFRYTVEDGRLTEVALTVERGRTGDWLSLPAERLMAAVMAFTWAQEDAPFFPQKRQAILREMGEAGLEGFTLRQAGTVITLEIEQKGFDYVSSWKYLIPQEGAAEQYVTMDFRVRLEE